MAKRLFYTDGHKFKSIDLPQYPDDAWNFLSEPPDLTEHELYSRVAAVYRAANMTADAIANLPFAVVTKRGKDVDTSASWSNAVGFMPRPRELLRLWRLSLLMTNTAYGFMERDRSGNETLRYLIPSTIEPVVDQERGLIGFKRRIRSRVTEYNIEDKRIFYIWRLDHTTELLPSKHTEFRAMMAAAGVLYYADHFIQSFFRRGGIKPTMLLVKGVLNPAERERIESVWDKVVHGWYKYLGKIFNADAIEPQVIGDGVESLKDQDISSSKIADIAMAVGMPLSLLLANSANYATATQEYLTWFRHSVLPWAEYMAECLTDQIFAPLGLRFEFRPEMTDPEQESEEQRALAFRNYVETGMKPSVAAQILGIDLPPGMTYADLDPQPPPQPAQEVKSLPSLDMLRELELWRTVAMRRHKRGESMPLSFAARFIPPATADLIRLRLETAEDRESICKAFDLDGILYHNNGQDTELIRDLAQAINRVAESENVITT